MKIAFMKRGATYHPMTESDNVHLKLPPGNYVIKVDPEDAHFYFEEVAGFVIPKRLYGDLKEQSARILSTFNDRSAGTGVLLSGDKGSGKTLLAKMVSVECAEKGVPTIIVDRSFAAPDKDQAPGAVDKFYKLLQDVQHPVIIFFDEFEKTHNKDQQEAMLTLLDGVFQGKKLFLLTCNSQYAIDEHMLNRPGRLFYHLTFEGMPVAAIREYCEENLKAKQYIDKILQMASFFDAFNFDMMQALVEEMNRYDEDPYDAVKMLNIRPRKGLSQFAVKVFIKEVEASRVYPALIEGSPIGHKTLTIKHTVGAPVLATEEAEPEEWLDLELRGKIKWEAVTLSQKNLRVADLDRGIYKYQSGDVIVEFEREKEPPFDYRSFAM